MLVKSNKFNGQISIKLKNNKFEFMPFTFSKQFAILFDASEDKFKNEKVKLNIKSKDSTSRIIMFLEKFDVLSNKENILELSLDTHSFSIDVMGRSDTEYKKTIQILGDYTLRSDGLLAEVVFNHNKGNAWTILCRPQHNMYDSYRWLCGFWPGLLQNGRFYLSINRRAVKESWTIADCGDSDALIVDVAEKCYVYPITKDDLPVELPWNQRSCTMVQDLSAILAIELSTIRIFGEGGRDLDGEASLEVDDFRSDGATEAATLFFDIPGATVSCKSMMDERSVVEVMVVGERTVSRVKDRLAFKMKVDSRRLILCRKNSFLLNNEEIPMGKELEYCVCSPAEDIGSKKQVGEGGFGKVHKCTKATSGEIFALKEFNGALKNDSKCNIIREILINLRIGSHDNIVGYTDIYINNDDFSIGMEFMEGGSLSRYLEICGPLLEKYVRVFSIDILQGLNYLHHKRTSHRDIKGDNVLLTHDNVAKLCDFGLSKMLTDFSRSNPSKEQSHTKEVGTYRWMAPEVINGGECGPDADMWSFGATVVQMITGHAPYHQKDEQAVLLRISQEKNIEFEQYDKLSEPLKDVVDACLKAEPKERLSCAELLALPFLRDKQPGDLGSQL